jgi:RNA polymerase sigma factor (sigma-70 family)
VKTDAQLIKEARSDPDAFAALYERYARSLHGWLRGRTGDPGVAMDLTAETFAQAALGLRRFRDERRGTAAPWLFGIAANLLRTYYERNRVETAARRRLGLPLERYEGGFDDVDERSVAESVEAALREALDDLPAGQRRALELRVVEERPYAEVAALLGTTEGAVRLRVMRALGSLSRTLKGAPL